jgi:hypothetical protein
MVHRFVMVACAMVALGLMVASPAQAGGGSAVSSPGAAGVKKPSTVKLKNNSTTTYFVLVSSTANLAEPTKFGTPGTVAWAKKLGAVNVGGGQTVTYPVPAGAGQIGIWDAAKIPQSGPITEFPATPPADYTVGSGKTAKWQITAGNTLAPQ